MASPPTTRPAGLKRGDTIAIVSPSARLNAVVPHRLARAQAWLESQGFRVQIVHDSSVPGSPLGASARGRAAELHAAFQDRSVRAIVCAIGGLACNELLPFLDPRLIASHPKIFIGSSDITLLHHFLAAACRLRSFYGPSAITQLAEWPRPLPFTWDHLVRVLMPAPQDAAAQPTPVGAMPRSTLFTDQFCDWESEPHRIRDGAMVPRDMKPSRGWKWLRAGLAEGPVWGGCLPSMLQLMGTQWDVSYKGTIMFIELPEGDAPGTGYPLDHAVWNLNDLRMRGKFAEIRGLVVGRPYLYQPSDEEEWESQILRAAEGYEFPILCGVDVGHTDPMLTLPLGARVRLDTEADEWSVLESGVC